MATYSEKLRDPRWQKKRLEVLSEDDFTCMQCKSKDIELHVHHIYYRKGREPWEYNSDELSTLCKYCHLIVGYFDKKEMIVFNIKKTKSHFIVNALHDKDIENRSGLYILSIHNNEIEVVYRSNTKEIGNNFYEIINILF